MGSVSGIVAAFDEMRGVGTIAAADATQYFFHCTQIADGTRKIEAGLPVTFEVEAGRQGRWEATAVTPRRPS